MEKLYLIQAEKVAVRIQKYLSKPEDQVFLQKLQAILMLAQDPDISCTDVAQRFGLSRFTVIGWVNKVNNSKGACDLEVLRNKSTARKTKLSPEQLQILSKALDHPPSKNGINSLTWTSTAVEEFVKIKFNITFHKRSIVKILDAMGRQAKKGRPFTK